MMMTFFIKKQLRKGRKFILGQNLRILSVLAAGPDCGGVRQLVTLHLQLGNRWINFGAPPAFFLFRPGSQPMDVATHIYLDGSFHLFDNSG